MHIYSGAWTLGFMDSFEILGQWEELDAGTKTFKTNLEDKRGIPHILAPSSEWPIEEFKRREVNLVYANPPCAPWSNAGGLLGMNDPRIQFAKNVSGAARELNPDFFVVESVCRAWSPTGGRPLYTQMALDWGRLGYAVTLFFTNTVLHGAPQFRERFHFIAHRFALDLSVEEPQPENIMTVWEAIHDLEHNATASPFEGTLPVANHIYEPYKPKAMNVVDRIGQGEGWDVGIDRCRADNVEFMKARFIAQRFRYNTTAPTLLDISQIVHPTQPRPLTMREGARLCGYPDWYEFAPNGRLSGYQANSAELTQAALPAVGRFLGRRFNRALDVGEPIEPCKTPEDINVVDVRPLGKPYRPRLFTKELPQ